MNVLHVIPAFYPATYWGGPIFSTYYLCNALARLPDLQLTVLTTDAAGPKGHQRVDVDALQGAYAGYNVCFCRRWFGGDLSFGMLARLWSLGRLADVVHLTAVYSAPTLPTLFMARVLRKPVVWSPRGALQRWEGTTRPWLKRAWEAVCRLLIVRGQAVLHVTSEEEAQESGLRIPNARCEVIPNGVTVDHESVSRDWIPGGTLRLLYIGRLHPKKGIENVLRAVAQLTAESTTLSICGTGDEGYQAELARLVEELGIDGRVTFGGHVDGDAKTAAFLSADTCVVPSFTENFGMVVAEALAHSVPVVASRGTPWSRVEDVGCGLWVENSPAALAAAISAMRSRNLAEMGRKGRQWMREEFGWDAVACQMHDLYARLAWEGT